MKKLLLIPFLLLTILPMAACGDGSEDPFTPETPVTPEQPGDDDNNDDDLDTPTPGNNGRYLVLYASRTNNTERVAQQIRTTLDCDILEVELEVAYDNDYNTMLERAQEELAAIRQGHYPAIKTSVENFDNYEIVFVGYPIWYGSMATPMQAFLHSHASKLSGKRIALFATSGSSGISSSVSEARNLCPDATIINETLLLTSSTLSQMATRVPAWLDGIGASREEPDEPDTPDATSLKMNITDTVLIGYPNWYAILPMPVYTFLESYNFSGKRIIPFCSHGNGMVGETVANICKTCPGADVREALSITYGGGNSLHNEIQTWLQKHNL